MGVVAKWASPEAGKIAFRHGQTEESVVENTPLFATRAADDHDLGTATPVVREGARTLAGFVVRMRVDRQQTQCHQTPRE